MPRAGRRGESWLLVLLLVALGRSERTAAPARLSLRGSWRLSNGNGSLVLRGDVPGCAHTALLRQGLIQVPYDACPPPAAIGLGCSGYGVARPLSKTVTCWSCTGGGGLFIESE